MSYHVKESLKKFPHPDPAMDDFENSTIYLW